MDEKKSFTERILPTGSSKHNSLLIPHAAPQRHRSRCPALRRANHFALGALSVLSLLHFLTPYGFLPRETGSNWSFLPGANVLPHESWPQSIGISYKELQGILHGTPSADSIRDFSGYYTAGPHLAGKNFSQALWTQQKWQEFGIKDTEIVAYDIYLNYPLDHRLALLKQQTEEATGVTTTTVTFEATLEEDVLDEDHTSGLPDRVPVFHGYSASGNVTAPFVFANFGTYADYDALINANITVEGKIVIVKYGGVFRGLKVKRAQELGAVGVIIYTDPEEDGEIIEENGYKPYPEGPARNPSSVQRGSTQFLSKSPPLQEMLQICQADL